MSKHNIHNTRYINSIPTRRSSDLISICQDALHLYLGWYKTRWIEDSAICDCLAKRAIIRRANAGQLPSLSRLRSEEHTSELQSPMYLVCRLMLEKKIINSIYIQAN